MCAQPRPAGEHILAMTVKNIGFLLDRLGQDCHQLQFLRELTQNSIEAVEREGGSGNIIWDVDWNTFELKDGLQKLCIIDNGDGMTGDEMVTFINQLSSSVGAQSMSGNYGVGAKIAAATRNHAGVIYLSWKDGQGYMILLCRDPETGDYGLKQWERADGTYTHYLPIEDEVKPEGIEDHGTAVILQGNAPGDSTLQPPSGVSSPSRWISKYLNTRYFRFPDGVTVKAREGWEYPRQDQDRNYLRTLTGQKAYLQQHAETSGSVRLSNATAHWWILKDEPAVTSDSGFIESSGHVAALYQSELYEMAAGRQGMSRLQHFGVTFGYRWVVIYLEPESDTGDITTNTARTHLLVGSEQLPWMAWANEFRENLPEEIAALVEEKAAKSQPSDQSKAIRERLKGIMSLFKISRYRAMVGGVRSIDDETMTHGGRVRDKARSATGKKSHPGGTGGRAGNIYAVFEKKDGAPGEKIKPDPFPVVKWVSVEDQTREPGDIEDRAAKYLSDQNLLYINADFRVYDDMVKFAASEYGDGLGVQRMAQQAVHSWITLALTETVMGIQGLRNSKEWSSNVLEEALSEVALTTAVMQRYHAIIAVRREVGSKLSQKSKRAG